MKSKQNEIVGVDVSKGTLEYHISDNLKGVVRNSDTGCESLIKLCQKKKVKHVIFEATGGYERLLSKHLERAGLEYSRVHPNRVKHFGKANGVMAKSDKIDAKLLCDFGIFLNPGATRLPSTEEQKLISYVTRRNQLVAIRSKEKTRLKSPLLTAENSELVKELIKLLTAQIKEIENCIKELVSEPIFAHKYEILTSFNGIGSTCAATLLAFLPELGTISRENIGAITGTAPYNNDSGTSSKQRSIFAGRKVIRDALYPATISAVTHNFVIRQRYQRLCSRQKAHKVAVIACMRKILVTLNAMVRDNEAWNDMRFVTDKKNFQKFKKQAGIAA